MLDTTRPTFKTTLPIACAMSVISRVRIRLRCFCTWLSSWSSFIKNFKNLNCTFTNRIALSTNTSTTKTFSSSSFEFEEDKEEEEEEEEEEVTPLKLMKADSSCSRRCLSKNSSEINSSSVSSSSLSKSSVRFLLVKISDIFFSNCAFLSTIFESRTRRREEEEVSSSSSSSSFSERRDTLPMMDDFSSLLLRKRKREKIESSLFRVSNPIVFETKEASAKVPHNDTLRSKERKS